MSLKDYLKSRGSVIFINIISLITLVVFLFSVGNTFESIKIVVITWFIVLILFFTYELFKSPVEIVDEGVIFIDTKMIEEDGKAKMINVKGSEKLMEADSVIIAVSQSPKNNIVSNTENLETNRHGLIVIDDIGHTTKEGVFASGDVVTGARTVVEAVANAKKVADAIDEFVRKNN